MFGSIGGPEVILLFIVALLLFGPRRLPEIGRTLGKTVADFRRATQEFRANLEREVRMEELKETMRPIEEAPRPETLARGMLLDVTKRETPASPEGAAPAPNPADPSDVDGGPGTVH